MTQFQQFCRRKIEHQFGSPHFELGEHPESSQPLPAHGPDYQTVMNTVPTTPQYSLTLPTSSRIGSATQQSGNLFFDERQMVLNVTRTALQ